MYEAIIYEKKNHIAILTMNRPETMNAMNMAMRREMGEAFVDFRDDKDSWVLIITGAGERAFSAGLDLREMAAGLSGGRASGGGTPPPPPPSLMEGTIEIWKPVISAINGVAVGGGIETALASDIRIAADNARLGLSEPKRGIIPGGGGLVRLPRLGIPLGAALEILLTGDLINAQEAYRLGLVNQVVPASELMPAAIKMAERLMESAPLALRAVKEIVMKARDVPSLSEALKVRASVNPYASEDAKEGTKAFNEKRKPVWKGE